MAPRAQHDCRPIRPRSIYEFDPFEELLPPEPPQPPPGFRQSITGALVVDLSGIDYLDQGDKARGLLAEIGQAPPGAKVIIRVGRVAPMSFMLDGVRYDHVHIEIESPYARNVKGWHEMLRGEAE